MIFKSQFKEVLYRVIYLISSFFSVFLIIYLQRDKAFLTIINPISLEIDLQTNTFFEAFFIQIEFCFYCSFFFFIPFLILQIWQFLIPALYIKERKIFSNISLIFSFFSFFSFFLGFFWFPSTLCYISKYLAWSENAPFLIQINLTNFIKTLCFSQFCFILYVSLVLILYHFSPSIPVNYSKLRLWIFFFFILISAILSPSDLLSQFLITLVFQIHFEILVYYNLIVNQCSNLMKLKKEIPLLLEVQGK